MDTPPNISSSQHEMRVYILDYFRKKKLITFHENVIYSEKVFKINAVLKWCFSQIQNKKMSFALWEKNKKFLAQYVAGIVDIEWGDNSFSVIEIENDQEPRTKRKTISRPNRRKRGDDAE
jgi:hypothetical protein